MSRRPESFEDAIARAADRLSAEIVRTALRSLDTSEASIVDNGKRYAREGVSRRRVMTSFGTIEYERSQYRRRGCRMLFPADRRAGLIENFVAAGVCGGLPAAGRDVFERLQPDPSL